MRTTVALAFSLLLAAPALAAPPEVSDSARAALEEVIAAMGGEEALAGVKGLRTEAKVL